jgi:ubiquinone/menaquinone biosynthesis C-methylase UbiE
MLKGKLESYWDEIYDRSDVEKLGWYEEVSTPSIELIQKANIKKGDSIFIAGTGISKLLHWLVNEGFNIIANDISEKALLTAQNKLGSKGKGIQWIHDDLTNPKKLEEAGKVQLWFDRAVLHFLIKDSDQYRYFELLRTLVSPGGFVIIAEFSKEGVTYCSGLPVMNYDSEMIGDGLGSNFYLIDSFHYVHKTPSGADRPYIYTLFKRAQIHAQ